MNFYPPPSPIRVTDHPFSDASVRRRNTRQFAAAPRGRLERLGQTGLLERVIGPMAGFDVVINHETATARAFPDFVIALSLAKKPASPLAQKFFHAGGVVVRHQAA